jgi:site-specific recombinase XerD
METQIAYWHEELTRQTGLNQATITEYVRDASQFAAWLQTRGLRAHSTAVTVQEAKHYRDYLLDLGRAPATVNRALVSLALFLDATGRQMDNPFRKIDRVEQVERPPRALSYGVWCAVEQAADQMVAVDHGLALALVCLMRYAGPRVGEVAALQLLDVQISSRRGLLIIRRGKGLKHREVPLIVDVRDPVQEYLRYRRHLAERWQQKAHTWGHPFPVWAQWPDGHLFLGQRGPLTERGIREIVAKVGQAAKLEEPLSPHALRHTFAKALLDPAAYHLDRPPATITAVQDLLGHADIATTAIYTRASTEDIARMMGEDTTRW